MSLSKKYSIRCLTLTSLFFSWLLFAGSSVLGQTGSPIVPPVLQDSKNLAQPGNLRYRQLTHQLSLAIEEGGDSITIRRLIDSMAGEVRHRRDGAQALVIGWNLLNNGFPAEAGQWFADAFNWTENEEKRLEAAYGGALALRQQGDEEGALRMAAPYRHTHAGMKKLSQELIGGRIDKLIETGDFDGALALAGEYGIDGITLRKRAGEMLLAKAWESYEAKDYAESRLQAERAISYLDDPFEGQTLLAWLDYQGGDYPQALNRFETLYGRHREPELARGIVASQVALGADFETLNGLLETDAADFAASVLAILSEELYWRREFLAAYKLVLSGKQSEAGEGTGPDMKKLLNIDSPAAGIFVAHRDKRGESGTSSLRSTVLSAIKMSYVLSGVHTASLSAYRWRLASGTVDPRGTPVGSAGVLQGGDRSLAAPPDVRLDEGWSLTAGYQRSGWWRPYAQLGITPIDGEIDPAVSLRLGVERQIRPGAFRLEFFSQPLRDSVLSFTGMRDPYSERRWGRVMKSGGEASLFYSLNKKWGLYGEVEGGWLEGEEVDDNQMIRLAAGIGYALNLDRFDYLTVGPQLSFAHYNDNRSHFTLGHGGYFSPDRFYNMGVGVDFLTKEGQKFIARGHAGLGYQWIDNEAAELFPGQPELTGQIIHLANGGMMTFYEASDSRGIAYDLECVGSWLFAPRWQLESGVGLRKTEGYEDYFIGIGLRHFFRPRKAMFSTDIPSEMFGLLL
jgi:hypothetical protein